MSSGNDSAYYSNIDTTLPNGLDPTSIVLNYTSPYGDSQVWFSDLDHYKNSLVQLAAIFGVRVGLSALALPVTYIITKNRKSPIFFLNMGCLATLFLHSVLFICTLNGTYNSFTYHFSGYEYLDGHSSRLSAATNTIYIILIALVESSLTYQVHVIFRSPNARVRLLGHLATFIAGCLGLATVGFYFAFVVMSNKALFQLDYSTPDWVFNASIICFATSSCVILLMLSIKLGLAIRTRKHLGLKQFSVFHVLFIMAGQTM
ncbi:unnamed protein product, partial [Ambrosiozyma monospora]